ncbi:high mobility group box domain-containing protein [Obelidium mucronatum]|nr:high mobility group box domain-containing protein [Obelidium mucronatum]
MLSYFAQLRKAPLPLNSLSVSFAASFATKAAAVQTPASDKLLAARRKLKALSKPTVTAPKRPLSSYLLFSQDKRDSVKSLPEIKSKPVKDQLGLVAKELGALWAAASAVEKKKYEEKAEEAKKIYQTTYKKYISSRTPQDILIEEKTRSLKQTINPTKPVSRVAKDPHAPVRPSNGYQLFVKEKKAGPQGAVETFSTIAAQWKGLNGAQKQVDKTILAIP